MDKGLILSIDELTRLTKPKQYKGITQVKIVANDHRVCLKDPGTDRTLSWIKRSGHSKLLDAR